jgi:hypothetical protein
MVLFHNLILLLYIAIPVQSSPLDQFSSLTNQQQSDLAHQPIHLQPDITMCYHRRYKYVTSGKDYKDTVTKAPLTPLELLHDRYKYIESDEEHSSNDQRSMHQHIPARTAVLATNELLRQILSSTPIGQLPSLRRVCKTWNSVINSIEYHVDPIRIHTHTSYPYPRYPLTLPIAFNPAITYQKYGRIKGSPGIVHDMQFEIYCDSALGPPLNRLGNMFLTHPPVTQVSLTAFRVEGTKAVAMLRVPDGIRMYDLAKTFRKMKLHTAGDPHFKRCKGHIVGVHLICTRGGLQDFSVRQQILRKIMLVVEKGIRRWGFHDSEWRFE